MQALGPDDCRLSSFELDLDFPGVTEKIVNSGDTVQDPASAKGNDCTADVCLIDFPAPSCVEGTTLAQARETTSNVGSLVNNASPENETGNRGHPVPRRRKAWKLHSSLISDRDSGRPRMARRTWEAYYDIRHVPGRIFHGGIAITHPEQPFEVTCHVRGKVSKPGGFRLKFSSQHHNPRIWRVSPQVSGEDLQHYINQLEEDMIRLNGGSAAAGFVRRKCCASEGQSPLSSS